jgi:predicted nucleotidyltransferase
MRTFAPLSDGDLPVPAELLDSLVDTLGTDDNWVVIGAAARDIALALGCVALPRRATNDIDIAVAAHDTLDFETTLAAVGKPKPPCGWPGMGPTKISWTPGWLG